MRADETDETGRRADQLANERVAHVDATDTQRPQAVVLTGYRAGRSDDVNAAPSVVVRIVGIQVVGAVRLVDDRGAALRTLKGQLDGLSCRALRLGQREREGEADGRIGLQPHRRSPTRTSLRPEEIARPRLNEQRSKARSGGTTCRAPAAQRNLHDPSLKLGARPSSADRRSVQSSQAISGRPARKRRVSVGERLWRRSD